MSDPIQTAAVAAALSGERAFETVSYPTTGDQETDLMVAILAVVKLKLLLPRGARSRILRYLADRFEQEEKIYDNAMGAPQGLFGGVGSAPNPYQALNAPPPYQSTGGLGGLQGQMQGSNAQWHSSAQSLTNQTQPVEDMHSNWINAKAQSMVDALGKMKK